MKKIILAAALLSLSSVAVAESSSLKEGVRGVVSGVVSSGKDAISGVKDGIDDGRKSGDSIDGAVIITTKDALQAYVTVSVLSVEKLNATEYKLTLAIRNNSDKTVRLTNLYEQKSLQLLDKDGFVSYVKYLVNSAESDITVPEKAAVRARYTFSEVEGVPAVFRLYGMDVNIPDAVETGK